MNQPITPPTMSIWRSPYALLIGFGLVALGSSPLSGCNCDPPDPSVGVTTSNGTGTTPSGLAVPIIDPLPEVTNNPDLPITGTKEANVAVLGFINDSTDPVTVALATASIEIDGEAKLSEGSNSLVFYGQNIAGDKSENTETFTVILDTSAPATPGLTAEPPECVGQDTYVLEGTVEPGSTVLVNGEKRTTDEDGSYSATVPLEDGDNTFTLSAQDPAGNISEETTIVINKSVTVPELTSTINSPTTDIEQVLRGTKGSGTGVDITFDDGQTWETIVAPSPETNWQATVTLPETAGENTFSLRGSDGNGGFSCDNDGPYTLSVSDVCPPVVSVINFISPTMNPELTISGDKCEGTSVWFRYTEDSFDNATRYVELNNDTTFSFNITLREGPNEFTIHTQDEDSLFSAGAGPFLIILDTTPPDAPTFDPAPPAQTGEESLDLTGTKEEGSSICIRYDQEPNCTIVVFGNPNEAFDLTANLQEGTNQVCISAFDEAGNQSEETCYDIERVGAANLSIITPGNFGVINDSPLLVQVNASDENGIDNVEICLENDCGDGTNNAGTIYERTITPGNLENGQVYTVTATATNGAGVEVTTSVQVVYLVGGFLLSNTSPAVLSSRPQIAIDSNSVVHVAWFDSCGQEAACEATQGLDNLPDDIFYRRLTADGWSDITVVNDHASDGVSENVTMVVDDQDIVHFVWSDNGGYLGAGPDSDLYHRSYNTTDETWGDVSLVTEGSSQDDTNVDMSTSIGTGLAITWHRRTDGDFSGDLDVYYSRFANGIWSASEVVSETLGTDNGDGTPTYDFDPDTPETYYHPDGDSRNPRIAVDAQGAAFITWQERGAPGTDHRSDWDVFMRRIDGGIKSDIFLVSDNGLDGTTSINPDIEVDTQRSAHVVWQDNGTPFNSGDDADIFIRSYSMTNPGDLNSYEFSPYILVTESALDGASEQPSFARNPITGGLYLAWIDTGDINNSGDDADIFIAAFEGAVSPPMLISGGTDFDDLATWPTLAIDPNTGSLFSVWEDRSQDGLTGDDNDIFVMGVQP